MKPGGLVLPNVATVHVALLSDEKRFDDAVTFWEDVYGFDFSSLIPQTKRDWASDPPVTTVDPACLASAVGGGEGRSLSSPRVHASFIARSRQQHVRILDV